MTNDLLGWLHSHHQIDDAQYRGGRAFQNDWERAERGPQAVDGVHQHSMTLDQRNSLLRLNRAERELGADGAALVHDVLIKGLTMREVAEERCLKKQRWTDYFARRLQECLGSLARVYGFATESRPTRRRIA